MKNYIKIIYLFLLSTLFYSCTSEQNKTKDKNLHDNEKLMDSSHLKINFDSAVIIIDSVMGQSWDRNDKLILIPVFRELYEHSTLYLDDAINFFTS